MLANLCHPAATLGKKSDPSELLEYGRSYFCHIAILACQLFVSFCEVKVNSCFFFLFLFVTV